MTIWDNIYKNFRQGGEAWATLKEGLRPEFIKFVESQTFDKKKALDIGCGTGKYLVYLKKLGFQVSGIDSSETAIIMTKEALGNDEDLNCVNMYNYEIPADKFDLILSLSTIHHGLKKEVIAKLTPLLKIA